jgi:hypothetical protein
LQSIKREAFDAALAGMRASAPAAAAPGSAHALAEVATAPAAGAAGTPEGDPRRFLLRVMNDGSVALALRIEAAKALLGQGGR